jgi:hypothetical protein
MKKTNYKDILIHSLELRIFLVELERMLFDFNIRTQNHLRRLPASEEQSEE